MSLELGIAGIKGLSVVGRGGSGTVYHALSETGDNLAVKIFTGVWDKPQQRRFERELEAMEILKDVDGVVPLLDHGKTVSDNLYLLMPYYENGSLQKLLKDQGSLEQAEAIELVSRAASVLMQTHAHDVFHRDLKPGNILLTENGCPVIADFGVTQISDGRSLSTSVVYTPGFCAPEALSKGREKVDGTFIDVYSLGATLWSALTGRVPFTRPGEYELDTVVLLNRIATEQLAKVEGVDDWVNAVIAKATNKNSIDRYNTMQSFLNSIKSCGHSDLAETKEHQQATITRESLEPSNTEEMPVDSCKTKTGGIQKHWRLVASVAVVVALLSVIGFFALRPLLEVEIANGRENIASLDQQQELPEEQQTPETVVEEKEHVLPLGELTPAHAECGAALDFGEAEINGRSYSQSLTWRRVKNSEVCLIEYELNGDWNSFRGVIGVRDDSNFGAKVQFEVLIDGVVADLRSDPVLEAGRNLQFELDVTGATRVELVTTNLAVGTLASWVWGTPELITSNIAENLN